MKETLRLILVLTVTATLTGVLLAVAGNLTRDPIAAARRADLLNALNVVLPAHDNEPDRETAVIQVSDREWTFYPARQAGAYVGAAFTSTAEGYGGSITVMIGVNADDRINAVQILNQLETPGLGANITQTRFTDQFTGQTADRPAGLAVRQDGGEIQAITAATISSRAVAAAVAAGLKVYQAHRESVVTPPPSRSPEAPSSDGRP